MKNDFELLKKAVESNDLEKVEELLAIGTPCSVEIWGDYWLIQDAVRSSSPEIVQTLLSHGASIKAQDYKGNTLVHDAAMNGKVETLKVLLAHGADVLHTDSSGRTMLDAFRYAVACYHLGRLDKKTLIEIEQLLYTATDEARRQRGMTPIDTVETAFEQIMSLAKATHLTSWGIASASRTCACDDEHAVRVDIDSYICDRCGRRSRLDDFDGERRNKKVVAIGLALHESGGLAVMQEVAIRVLATSPKIYRHLSMAWDNVGVWLD